MLDELLRLVEAGGRLPAEPWYQVVAEPGTHVIMGFTGHIVIVTDLGQEWVDRRLPADDLSAPMLPPFLSAIEVATGRRVNNIDMLMMAPVEAGEPRLELKIVADLDHPRVRRASRYRTDLTVYQADGGVLIVGRGVGGRWEAAIEVDEPARGRGLGRALAAAARRLVPEARPVWVQIAPGNAASVRAFLAAGYAPVGSEALFVP